MDVRFRPGTFLTGAGTLSAAGVLGGERVPSATPLEFVPDDGTWRLPVVVAPPTHAASWLSILRSSGPLV